MKDNQEVGRPFGQPAGGPADLSPQAVSALPGAHQAHEALKEICKLVAYAFDGVLVAPQALDAIDDVAKAALARLEAIQ